MKINYNVVKFFGRFKFFFLLTISAVKLVCVLRKGQGNTKEYLSGVTLCCSQGCHLLIWYRTTVSKSRLLRTLD